MILETDRAEIHRVVLGPLSTNVYVIRCSTSSRSIMVDAADNGPFLAGLCERFNAAQVLLSHGHWDHIQGVPALRSSGVEVAIEAGDAAMLGGNYDELLSHNSTVMAGDVALQVIHTPGHTPGSCCFGTQRARCSFPATPFSQEARATPPPPRATSMRSSPPSESECSHWQKMPSSCRDMALPPPWPQRHLSLAHGEPEAGSWCHSEAGLEPLTFRV